MPGLFFEIAVPVEGDSLVVDGPRPSPGRARPSTTTCWALRPGQQAYCSGGRSASKIGSSTSIAAVMQTRSRKVKMPSGLSLQPRPVTVYRDTLTEGFSHFVTSIAAPVASGWSDCRGRDRGTARVLQIFPRIPGPLPRRLTRCAYPFLPLSHRPSPNPNGSAQPRVSAQRLQSGGCLRGCSHSLIFRPPSLLPSRSFPPLALRSGIRAAVAFTSEQNAVRCLPAHRIC